jgi:AcrR family transcriptional regulator
MRDRQRQAAHEAILDAAEQVFGEQGIAAGMEQIAARAGVAVGTLYNHFADRSALVEALADARRERLFARLEVVAAETRARPFAKRLEAVLGALADVSGQQARFRRSLLEAGLLQDTRKHREARRRFQPFLAEVFAAGVREGALRAGGQRVLLAHLVGLFKATFELALESPEVLPLAQVPKVVAQAFLRGHGVVKRKARP